eukprot:scaffold5926_cov21-Tisochrysis_lutea.AAC.4
MFGVAVLQRACKLHHVGGSALLAEAHDLLQLLVELPACCILQDEVDLLLVIEVAKAAEDVGVTQVGLDLNLAPQLVLH